MADKLTPQQQMAVASRGGKLLVSAAAGSGKTKVLVDRLLGFLTQTHDPANLDEFLIITFTRAAAEELRARIAKEIAEALGAEITAITDDCDRSGWRGYMRCGMDAMKTSTRPLQPFETEKPLGAYKLVIVGSPVWAGRCASPIRALLKRRGLEMENVAYVVTRSTTQRSEEVYDQMDMYTGQAHRLAVSLRPDSEGYEFWRNDFIQNVRRLLEND